MSGLHLESAKVIGTVERLVLRIEDRFSKSGLSGVCNKLLEVAQETERTIQWIEKTNLWLRGLSLASIAGIIVVVSSVLTHVNAAPGFTIMEFIQVSEAGVNLLILLSIALYFLWTIELKLKRERVVRSINRLRDMAHIIDMHQLTKDPFGLAQVSRPTTHSPKRELSTYDLSRYLDYCSEMLSLISKLGYLYIAKFDDPMATQAVNDLEDLTTGLSRKIWQKIMLLREVKEP